MRAACSTALLLLAAACSNTPAPSSQPTVPTAREPSLPSAGTPRAFQAQDAPLSQVLASARTSGRPAMLLFRTDWCGYCRKLEQETLPDARVRAEAARYTAMAYDADRGPGKELAARYGVRGFPTLVLVDAAGNKLDDWAGFNEPEIYAAILRQMRAAR